MSRSRRSPAFWLLMTALLLLLALGVYLLVLGDYLSSADQAVECKTYLRDAEYDQADALEASGDLQGAYDLFSSLSGYRDAAQRAEDLAAQLGIE